MRIPVEFIVDPRTDKVRFIEALRKIYEGTAQDEDVCYVLEKTDSVVPDRKAA